MKRSKTNSIHLKEQGKHIKIIIIITTITTPEPKLQQDNKRPTPEKHNKELGTPKKPLNNRNVICEAGPTESGNVAGEW